MRTRAFKEWFGDWEKAARIEKLRQSDVLETTGEEYGRDYTDRATAKQWMKDHLRGAYTNKDTGEKIEVSNVGINEVLSHGTTNESHMRSLAAIPRMLENSIFIDEAANSKGNSKYDRYRYYAVGLRINGEDYTAKLVVGVKNGARYYDHRLTQIEKGALIDSLNRHSNSVAENQAPDMSGISNALSSVLQVNSSKIVDENGEPLVVWHGTREHFYEFEHGRAVGSGDIYGYLGDAFYATNDYETAESYADGGYKRTLGLFLNIRNPYETKNPDHTSPAHGGSFAKHLGVSPREVSPTLRQMGHDGVIATDEEAGYIEYAFYHSTQAKSATENVGTFDAGNPDIRYSLGGGTSTIRAWHGSPHEFDAEEGAPFGRFGLSFVGTGEGGQAFGYGIYLTSEEDIARHNYAQRLGDDDTAAAQRALGRFGLAWATFRADELAACVSFSDFKRELRAAAWSLEDLVEEGEMTAEELASDKASIREATKTREAFDALLSAMLATQDYFYESRREDLERALEEAGEGRKAKALREELERFDELKREADANERPRHHLYEARIRVADDASNLLDWVARPSEEQLERIRAGLRERGVSEEAAVRLTAAGSFGEIYRSISEELGGAAKASETLKAAGFAGHKYPADSVGTGAADYSRGTNYVIYDTGATEITGAVRWLRNDSGVVYGYWDEGSGELHLNEDFADFDTPLHEWAHVWLSWVRKADARLARAFPRKRCSTKSGRRLFRKNLRGSSKSGSRKSRTAEGAASSDAGGRASKSSQCGCGAR